MVCCHGQRGVGRGHGVNTETQRKEMERTMDETTSEQTKQDDMNTSFETVEEKMVQGTNQSNVTDDNLEDGFTDVEHQENDSCMFQKT